MPAHPEPSVQFGGEILIGEQNMMRCRLGLVDDQELTFVGEGDAYIDDQTSSTWNVFGEATDGSLAGATLEPVTFVRTFWFSWAAFRPDTNLIDAS